MKRVSIPVEILDEGGDTTVETKIGLTAVTLVIERNRDSRIEKSKLAKTL